ADGMDIGSQPSPFQGAVASNRHKDRLRVSGISHPALASCPRQRPTICFCRHSGASRNPFGFYKPALEITMDPGVRREDDLICVALKKV
ncbi:hypothetical protein, partial [Dokdonella sp.]|uniref:hypothetical protein n=1 Tax=Dokdonella sp. TaxID=2291710 RepID=UPI002DD61D02